MPLFLPGSAGLITGSTGLELLATATQAEALAAIGAEQAIQIVTNINGTAWRFSGGLQICIFVGASLPIDGALSNGIFISQITTWTFPAAFTFNSRPTALCQPGDARRWAGTDVGAGNGVSCTYRQLAPYLDPVLSPSYLFAIGSYTL